MSRKIEFTADLKWWLSDDLHIDLVNQNPVPTHLDTTRYRVVLEPIPRELPPCSHCGGRAIRTQANSNKHSIICSHCGIRTPYMHSPERAEEIWIQRICDCAELLSDPLDEELEEQT